MPLQVLLPERLQDALGVRSFEQQRRQQVLRWAHGMLLDVGCGANRVVADHRLTGQPGYGCDLHPWPGIDVRADGARLPFRSASFDTVSLVAALNHIPDRQACMREVARVLRPGGRVLVTMIAPPLGLLAHALLWWEPDIHQRGMRDGERQGMWPNEVIGLAEEVGLHLHSAERFVAGLNRLFILEKGAIGLSPEGVYRDHATPR